VVGTDDLAYTYVLWWFPERRAAMEKGLIKRYHDGLLKHGVENYDWEDCWHDYRLSVIRTLFFPILFWYVICGKNMVASDGIVSVCVS